MDFNEKIRKRRLELDLTLEEVAKIVGVAPATIQRYETGEIKNVRRDKIAKLAKALKVSPSYLMGWEEEPDQLEELNKEFPEGVEVLFRAKDELTPSQREKMIAVINAFFFDEENSDE